MLNAMLAAKQYLPFERYAQSKNQARRIVFLQKMVADSKRYSKRDRMIAAMALTAYGF